MASMNWDRVRRETLIYKHGAELIDERESNDMSIQVQPMQKTRNNVKSDDAGTQTCFICGKPIRFLRTGYQIIPCDIDSSRPHSHRNQTISSAFETNRRRH